ncbi:NADH-quinone oxidoreductase subunit C [Paenibacillus filicis]|uniref:NADH-quinone oxidoreductase subunit C n=1 Tax=Paenibacillus filicis TaxID=669464 RepID=A0ABU9DS56_9BACL
MSEDPKQDKAGSASEPGLDHHDSAPADAKPIEPSSEAAAVTPTPKEDSGEAPAVEVKQAARSGEGKVAEVKPAEKAASSDEEKEAKAKAAADARAARAKERAAKAEAEAAPEAPKEPSPNQPLLDRLLAILRELPSDVIQESFINEKGGHVPYLVVKGEAWPQIAEMLKTHPELKLNYLRNVSGIDMETHMEVAYHLISLETRREYCVKVKTDREAPVIPSVTSIWPTANWNEREIYDLFGIDFPGHPDLRRIMMADDWAGHPLRKDYEPLDPEV